jgi:hypothetical protein
LSSSGCLALYMYPCKGHYELHSTLVQCVLVLLAMVELINHQTCIPSCPTLHCTISHPGLIHVTNATTQNKLSDSFEHFTRHVTYLHPHCKLHTVQFNPRIITGSIPKIMWRDISIEPMPDHQRGKANQDGTWNTCTDTGYLLMMLIRAPANQLSLKGKDIAIY